MPPLTPAQRDDVFELTWMGVGRLERLVGNRVMGFDGGRMKQEEWRPTARPTCKAALIHKLRSLGVIHEFGEYRRNLPHTLTDGARTCIAALLVVDMQRATAGDRNYRTLTTAGRLAAKAGAGGNT